MPSTDFASMIRWDLLPYINGDGLDVGCGDARPHDWMVGIDIKPGQTQKGPNQIRDGTTLDKYYAPESQDFIFSSHLLQELQDWPAVLAGWWKILKPDGYLIIFLPLQEERAAEGETPALQACDPKKLIDALAPLKPWQVVEMRKNLGQFFHVYRKCEGAPVEQPDPEKICAVMKLGAHGDAMWASSVMPHLKEQGYITWLYCQETTEEVLRHDPHIDRIIRFSSKVPLGELGELFAWMEAKYKHSRILVECVEGTCLPSPTKIQYRFPQALRHRLMNHNYLDVHHLQARVPMDPRQKFYPSPDEMNEANVYRASLGTPYMVVLVPNGSSCTKNWPYAGDLARRLLDEREDVTVVVMGDLRATTFTEHPRLKVIGTTWPVRKCFTLAQLANVLVGEETGLLNGVAFEKDVRKVALLTHSTMENLTRDWPNTATLTGDVHCYPCHRLHYNWDDCTRSTVTKAAACQSAISVSMVMREIEVAIGSKDGAIAQTVQKTEPLELATPGAELHVVNG